MAALVDDDVEPNREEIDDWIARWHESAEFVRAQSQKFEMLSTPKEKAARKRSNNARQRMIDRFKNPSLGRWDLVNVPVQRPE